MNDKSKNPFANAPVATEEEEKGVEQPSVATEDAEVSNQNQSASESVVPAEVTEMFDHPAADGRAFTEDGDGNPTPVVSGRPEPILNGAGEPSGSTWKNPLEPEKQMEGASLIPGKVGRESAVNPHAFKSPEEKKEEIADIPLQDLPDDMLDKQVDKIAAERGRIYLGRDGKGKRIFNKV